MEDDMALSLTYWTSNNPDHDLDRNRKYFDWGNYSLCPIYTPRYFVYFNELLLSVFGRASLKKKWNLYITKDFEY